MDAAGRVFARWPLLLCLLAACTSPDLPTPLGVLVLDGLVAGGSGSGANATGTAATRPKQIFLTANSTEGAMAGVDGADTRCLNDPNHPGSGLYLALLADGAGFRRACSTADCAGAGAGEHINWVLAANTTYVRSGSDVVIGTTDANGIFPFSSASLDNSFGSAAGDSYWTGMDATWVHQNSCSNWAVNSGSGDRGNGGATDGRSISDAPASVCNTNIALLCVEQ